MKIPQFLFAFAAIVLVAVSAHADDIKVAMAFDGDGGRLFVSMSPHGGLVSSKTGQVTERQAFVMQNLSGDKIQGGAQVKFLYGDSIWYRTPSDTIARIAARGSKDDVTVFELKDMGGQYRIMVPGGGWLGGPAENKKSYQIVENEEDAILVEFIENPLGENP